MSELAHMNRLATAGELSASIAHEVNQPMTGMVLKAGAALRWLPEDMPNAEKIRDLLTDIVSAGQRAGEIVAGVRAMFKKDTNEKVPVDINKLILTVLEIVRIDCEKSGVEVQTDLADELPDGLGRQCSAAASRSEPCDECHRGDALRAVSHFANRNPAKWSGDGACVSRRHRRRH